MNFLSPVFLYFLPLSLLPLISLFLKKRSSRITFVSWLFLLKDSEFARKRKFHRNLIVILRCLILALLLIFLAKPIPSRYAFKKIYFETGIFSQKAEAKNRKYLRSLLGYFGKRVDAFCDPLKPEQKPEGKIYIISDFSDPGIYQRFSGGFYFDTLSISNAGINSVDFDPVSKAYYLKITNYNKKDSVFHIVVYMNSRKLLESSFVLPKTKTILWKQEIPQSGRLLKICLMPEDDILLDNCLELSAPEKLKYYPASFNLYVENFMQIVGIKTSLDSADVLISFNRVLKPGKSTKEVIIFFDKPVEGIKSVIDDSLKESGPFKISGWNFGKVFLSDTSKGFTDIRSFLQRATLKLNLNGVTYVFIGLVPDIEKNDAVYCPDFWSYFLQLLNSKPVIAYTTTKERAGKILNDTLFLPDTLQTNTSRAQEVSLSSHYLPLPEVVKTVNTIRYLILGLLILLVALEFYLTFRYFFD